MVHLNISVKQIYNRLLENISFLLHLYFSVKATCLSKQPNTTRKGMEEMCMLTYPTISLFGNYIMEKWPALC